MLSDYLQYSAHLNSVLRVEKLKKNSLLVEWSSSQQTLEKYSLWQIEIHHETDNLYVRTKCSSIDVLRAM